MQLLKVFNKLKHYNNYTVYKNSSVYEALISMAKSNLDVILVLDDNDDTVGIFTHNDYTRGVLLNTSHSIDTHIQEVMSANICSVGPYMTLEECLDIFINHNITYAPILDHKKCIGLLAIGEISQLINEEREFLIDQLNKYICGDPFAKPLVLTRNTQRQKKYSY
ncbi:MAG: CBS domain-containing protein [Bdellovibrionaceae bacterium]|jgi:predicted transcriptional regulator|nr:CBS domain-containing protein [Pseudobdellovibrionaceae bacterium]